MRKNKNLRVRISVFLLSVVIVLSLTPQLAMTTFAEEDNPSSGDISTLATTADNVPYIDATGSLRYRDNVTVINSENILLASYSLSNGWYLLSGTVEFPNKVIISDVTDDKDVHLILEDGANISVKYNGILVPAASKLTIYAQSTGSSKGNLTSSGIGQWGDGTTGIGGDYANPAGTIIINGGNITAIGFKGNAGIGGSAGRNGGTVIINGGTVNAWSDDCSGSAGGAGIGGGSMDAVGNSDNTSLSITINGGTVTATGATCAAGIGGGTSGSGGTITISGGTVIANGGSNAAGIGGGSGVRYSAGSGGNITISGGNVTANGGNNGGAGIGGGGSRSTSTSGGSGNITITGNANVAAIGGSSNTLYYRGGAGIGSGGAYDKHGRGGLGSITINTTGTVTATGGKLNGTIDGATIGRGGHWVDPLTVLVPGAPLAVSATADDKQVTLDWTEASPLYNYGSPVDITPVTYEISVNGDTWTPVTGNTGSVITGLNNGTTYTFEVRAVNCAGVSTVVAAPSAVIANPLEPTPYAFINYEDETLTGLTSGATYIINNTEYEADGNGNIGIDWFGQTISLIKKGNGITTNNSGEQSVVISPRPNQPTGIQGVKETISGQNDGQIIGASTEMEYRNGTSGAWNACTNDTISNLAPGTYQIRIAAVSGISFAGEIVTITIAIGQNNNEGNGTNTGNGTGTNGTGTGTITNSNITSAASVGSASINENDTPGSDGNVNSGSDITGSNDTKDNSIANPETPKSNARNDSKAFPMLSLAIIAAVIILVSAAWLLYSKRKKTDK